MVGLGRKGKEREIGVYNSFGTNKEREGHLRLQRGKADSLIRRVATMMLMHASDAGTIFAKFLLSMEDPKDEDYIDQIKRE